jgi:hypothetical protein
MPEPDAVQYHRATTDFKYKMFPKWGTPLPPDTAAAEFFRGVAPYKTEEIVFADAWFTDYYRVKDEPFWEKCFYLPGNKLISLIWKKER